MMPLHQYINTETMEQYEEFRTWDDDKKYLEENPKVKHFWTWKAETNPSEESIGITRSNDPRHAFEKKEPSKKFNKFLKKVQKDHPKSQINT